MESKNKSENIENEPKLEVVFNPDLEVQRIENTIKNIPWFKEYGYFKYLKLPKNISEISNIEDISTAISSEFNEDIYKEYADYLETEFPNMEKQLEALKDLKFFNLKDHYIVKLTKYGTGGSYDSSSGEIIINIQACPKEKIPGNIIHEITHIGIEDLIEKNNVKQWNKERIVDLIDEKLFPGLNQPQKYQQKDVSFIDSIFNKFFPDMEAVIKTVGETKI